MADTSALMTSPHKTMTPDYLSALLAGVVAARPRERANAFAVVHAELNRWLSDCVTGDRALLAPCRDPERFVAQARTYLRALSTYRPVTDAWLDVFRAFRQLIEDNTVRRQRTEPSAPPLSRLSRAEIAKLQEMPGQPRPLGEV